MPSKLEFKKIYLRCGAQNKDVNEKLNAVFHINNHINKINLIVLATRLRPKF
jgi:hypothetical protein